MRKQKIKPYKKLLYIESRRVDTQKKQTLRAEKPEINIIIYREGRTKPKLDDIRKKKKKKHIY